MEKIWDRKRSKGLVEAVENERHHSMDSSMRDEGASILEVLHRRRHSRSDLSLRLQDVCFAFEQMMQQTVPEMREEVFWRRSQRDLVGLLLQGLIPASGKVAGYFG